MEFCWSSAVFFARVLFGVSRSSALRICSNGVLGVVQGSAVVLLGSARVLPGFSWGSAGGLFEPSWGSAGVLFGLLYWVLLEFF